MKILKYSLIAIIAILLMCSLSQRCSQQREEKNFLDKYEHEDFSQFNGVSVFIRGGDSEKNPIIFVNAPHLIKDTSRVGYYVVTMDKNKYKVIKAKWMTEHYVEADTLKLQQLAQKFMKYKIPRMNVDTLGNVFIYLKDVETLSLA
jgi:hypothetical protein